MLRRPQPLVCLACSVLVLLAGCSGGGGPAYDSPEACFNGIKAAISGGDFKTALNGVTDESQSNLSGLLVMAGAGMKAAAAMAGMMGSADNPEAKKLLDAAGAANQVMEKHGVTDEQLKGAMGEGGVMGMMMSGGPSEDAISQLAGVVDDKAQFILDMVEAFMQLSGGEGPDPQEIIDAIAAAKLSDVKIDGDSATGTVTVQPPDGAPEETEEVTFRKTGEGWKLHLDLDALQPAGPDGGEMEMGEGGVEMEFDMGDLEEGGEAEFDFSIGDEEGDSADAVEEDAEAVTE